MFVTSSRWLILATSLFLSVACEKNLIVEAELIESSIIFGNDDRQRVTGPRTLLDRTVGELIGIDNEGKSYRCSAISLKDEYILTAAHCFYAKDTLIQNVYFYPSIRAENIIPFGRFPVLKMMKPSMYNPRLQTLTNIGFDIAIAKVGPNAEGKTLKQIIGGTGWWGPKNLSYQQVSTMGYPGDKPNSAAFFQEDCFIDDYRTLVYESDCDVYSGQSGSPVFIYHEETKKKYVIGVIAGDNNEANLVVKITPERQRILDAITAEKYEEEKDQFLEKWQTYVVPLSRTVNIIVNNTCKEDILVAYTAQDMDRKWQTVGFIPVKSQNSIEVTRTPNRIYRLHAHIPSNRTVAIGHEHLSSVPGSRGNFKFSEFRVEGLSDRVHTIGQCQ